MQTALVTAISVKLGSAKVIEAPLFSIIAYTCPPTWMHEASVANAYNATKLIAVMSA